MRKETKEITYYQFEELSDNAKQKAIEKLWDLNVDHEWWDGVYEDANQVGITINGFDLDRNRYCNTTICNPVETAELIIENHGKDCETYKTAKSFLDQYQPLKEKSDKIAQILERYECGKWSKKLDILNDKLINDYEELEHYFKRDITEDYSVTLQKEYDYLTSEESIIESIKANEYEFDVDGNII